MKEMERWWSAANEWKVWWVIEFRGSGVVGWNDEGGPKGVKGGIVQKNVQRAWCMVLQGRW